jgi:hypothetical protein
MSHPTTKKQRLEDNDDQATNDNDELATVVNLLASFGALSVDLVAANIFAFLMVDEIMSKRRINKKSKEAVKMTIVPLIDFGVWGAEAYNAMNVMTEAMPNLQQITIGDLEAGHKWSVGEDPDEERAAATVDYTPHDIEIISNFSKLKILEIEWAPLNGRYPVLFNSFPLLQKLSIKYCYGLKWDLGMLAELPLLKELECSDSACSSSNINSLRVRKYTLEKVKINDCENVEGNFMDLADFLHLKQLDLDDTAVTGDIRDIGDNDFSSLEHLILPKGVYGGNYYELQSIADATDLVRSLYLLKKRRPTLAILKEWHGDLSADSPDWYAPEDEDTDSFPFYIQFVKAGSRLGYQWRRWETYNNNRCEVNWLDPEPDRGTSDYGKYIEELEQINSEVCMFRGFHHPPTEEEYNRLIEEYEDESEESEESDNESSEDEEEESDDDSEEEDEESDSESSDSEE